MPWSHFHFLVHICLLDSEQIMEQKHFGRQWQGRDSRVEGWCFKCAFSSAYIDFSPLHFVTAKCSGQKCNKTGSRSCSWGQQGHRSLHWCVGNISQMTEAQLENSKWLQSDVGAILHMLLITACLNLVQFASGTVMLVNQASMTPEHLTTTIALHCSFLSTSLFPMSFINTRIGSHDSIYSLIQVTIIKHILCFKFCAWLCIDGDE